METDNSLPSCGEHLYHVCVRKGPHGLGTPPVGHPPQRLPSKPCPSSTEPGGADPCRLFGRDVHIPPPIHDIGSTLAYPDQPRCNGARSRCMRVMRAEPAGISSIC